MISWSASDGRNFPTAVCKKISGHTEQCLWRGTSKIKGRTANRRGSRLCAPDGAWHRCQQLCAGGVFTVIFYDHQQNRIE